jgi:hypothetical protein
MTHAPTHVPDPPTAESPALDQPGYLAGTRSYPYAWAPVVAVFGIVTLFAVPYLAVLLLFGVVLLALWGLAKLAWMGLTALYDLRPPIERRHEHVVLSPQNTRR